jgi:hypothetical protein
LLVHGLSPGAQDYRAGHYELSKVIITLQHPLG